MMLLFSLACNNESDMFNTQIVESDLRQPFLSDIDYLMTTLENNFPFLGVAYWARGVDINQLAAEARQTIIEQNYIDEDIFWNIITECFEPMFGIGHFLFLPPLEYVRLLAYRDSAEFDFFGISELLDSVHVQSFYHARLDDDILYLSELLSDPEPIITICEKTSVVTVKIPAFSISRTVNEELARNIIEIYPILNEFDHLIIDLRGNPGGWPWLFTDFIVKPLIGEHKTVTMFVFFMDGEYISRFNNNPIALTEWIYPALTPGRAIFGSADEIIAQNDFVDLNKDDINEFSYAFLANIHITPRQKVSFDGNVWLLVDEHMTSGAQMAAWIAKDTGFSTLVGEITGGSYGGARLLSALPNTGILFQFDLFYITDRYGRSLESGTIPHYFNYPDMDAMETVLAMIAYGVY